MIRTVVTTCESQIVFHSILYSRAMERALVQCAYSRRCMNNPAMSRIRCLANMARYSDAVLVGSHRLVPGAYYRYVDGPLDAVLDPLLMS